MGGRHQHLEDPNTCTQDIRKTKFCLVRFFFIHPLLSYHTTNPIVMSSFCFLTCRLSCVFLSLSGRDLAFRCVTPPAEEPFATVCETIASMATTEEDKNLQMMRNVWMKTIYWQVSTIYMSRNLGGKAVRYSCTVDLLSRSWLNYSSITLALLECADITTASTYQVSTLI